ncbi:MAG: hypothetical protein A3G52_04025 [Candidatus Taylorbacteria bacterium RIFCSPLOWO2_12_FULL_43_20]|uniref:Fido domain-containing protein n=1 Tax=Candidatus Taylorbacteria bacterium RIFCSPLOWO2_12_FULL_43_20 TaxID=1802332 RepID=A0A1G2P0A7_9BACT|nr:MAG: hypothetical protein A2825_00925 [Candidatus Taylorbacteria bacterium RIFCSPHIGHO2_01_FULL_43_120]OHA22909.1 MAG: hypothetical protein A3B98_03730 [Candidatus Taylorbacteria bacterium RIFCSPHIGHO2_02_FULL_43_55]OHA30007.1 MAG: hypothetical protein A3E92_04190 [Candidatus Taylorbacteria bacterium RIFCSPHIGHO2_12_FULL_42_34]OHA30827.1 MAG: hypothetical protein A3B09_01370 [Candidatus Taylorbacteria bacterium RIFCSPLOWO2_01_FULL_43_83]OHA39116.1 MAG: hypothetical protein A3H58_00060 [Candi
MHYITEEDILVIHARIIDQTGGSHGVRDVGLLKSITHKPKTMFGNKELYVGLFTKTAVLFEAIVNYHVFVDGNKRTAIAAASRFLYINGYELSTSNKKMVDFVLDTATKKILVEQIAKWFKSNSVPSSSSPL